MPTTTFRDIIYVSDGRVRRADIVIAGGLIDHIADKEDLDPAVLPVGGDVFMPGVIDSHVHTREPGLTHKGDLTTETRAAAAGGVTTIMDMPNVVPQTTTLDTLAQRQALGRDHAFVNYTFYFGATNTNATLLPQLDPATVPAVKLFMGSSTGGMLVDHGEALEDVFRLSPLPIMAHCEDSYIIDVFMRRAQSLYGKDPHVGLHPEIRSRLACTVSSKLAVRMALQTGARLHIAHVSTAEELDLAAVSPRITLEACLPHLLFCDDDYASLGTRIKCNPSVKSRKDRDALRCALTDGRITTVATDHAPHLLAEKQGGCLKAASGIPMVQFSLVAMMDLVHAGVLSLPRLVELMCHAPARLFDISRRGFIREGMCADLAVIRLNPWFLKPADILSRCGWSPLENHFFVWRVCQTYCNGRLIYDHGRLADGNSHAQQLTFER